jgi:hypothetical protein
MLIKLRADQIAIHWWTISKFIQKSLPPTVAHAKVSLRHIEVALLSDHMTCWVVEENNKMKGVILTIVVKDRPSGVQNLQIYSLTGMKDVERDTWVDVFNGLSKYAVGMNCSCIIGYSANEELIKLLKRFGADTNYTYVAFPTSKFFDSGKRRR